MSAQSKHGGGDNTFVGVVTANLGCGIEMVGRPTTQVYQPSDGQKDAGNGICVGTKTTDRAF